MAFAWAPYGQLGLSVSFKISVRSEVFCSQPAARGAMPARPSRALDRLSTLKADFSLNILPAEVPTCIHLIKVNLNCCAALPKAKYCLLDLVVQATCNGM